MMSSNVLYFPGRAIDMVSHHQFHGHWSSNREVTQGDGISPPPLPPPGCTRFQKSWPA